MQSLPSVKMRPPPNGDDGRTVIWTSEKFKELRTEFLKDTSNKKALEILKRMVAIDVNQVDGDAWPERKDVTVTLLNVIPVRTLLKTQETILLATLETYPPDTVTAIANHVIVCRSLLVALLNFVTEAVIIAFLGGRIDRPGIYNKVASLLGPVITNSQWRNELRHLLRHAKRSEHRSIIYRLVVHELSSTGVLNSLVSLGIISDRTVTSAVGAKIVNECGASQQVDGGRSSYYYEVPETSSLNHSSDDDSSLLEGSLYCGAPEVPFSHSLHDDSFLSVHTSYNDVPKVSNLSHSLDEDSHLSERCLYYDASEVSLSNPLYGDSSLMEGYLYYDAPDVFFSRLLDDDSSFSDGSLYYDVSEGKQFSNISLKRTKCFQRDLEHEEVPHEHKQFASERALVTEIRPSSHSQQEFGSAEKQSRGMQMEDIKLSISRQLDQLPENVHSFAQRRCGSGYDRCSFSSQKGFEQCFIDGNAYNILKGCGNSLEDDVFDSLQSGALSLEQKIFTDGVSIKMKNECIRLWSNEVQRLPELLYFLQLCHHKNGPLLISNWEAIIESYFNPSHGQVKSSWIKCRPYMNVKRLFELKMFKLSPPPNRLKVQPVDCILMSTFHVLPRGLPSIIYNILLKSKQKTIEQIVKSTAPFLKARDDFGRRNEIDRAVMKMIEVIVINDCHVELKNDDTFFVVTDVESTTPYW